MRGPSFTPLSSLHRLIDQVQKIAKYFESLKYFHTIRTHNSQVESLANMGMQMEQGMLCKSGGDSDIGHLP